MKRFAISTLCLSALLLAACETEVDTTAPPADQPTAMDADIETYRTDVDVRLQPIDQAIANLETKAASAGEEMREAYNARLEDLREERMEIANDLTALRAETAEELQEAQREIDEEVRELRYNVAEARLAMAENAEELRAAADEELREMDREIESLRAEAGEESREAVAELEEQRREFGEALDRLGDATAEGFQDARDGIVNAFSDLGDAIRDIRVPVDVDVQTEPVG